MSIGGPWDCYPPRINNDQDYRKGYRDGYRDGVKDALGEPTDVISPAPWQQPVIPTWPAPNQTSSASKCTKCGMVFEGPMLYCCQDTKCPIFPRITFS